MELHFFFLFFFLFFFRQYHLDYNLFGRVDIGHKYQGILLSSSPEDLHPLQPLPKKKKK